MAVSRDLVINPDDIRISMQCKRCNARFEVSQADIAGRDVKTAVPGACPSCNDKWADFRNDVNNLLEALRKLRDYEVSFRVLEGKYPATSDA